MVNLTSGQKEYLKLTVDMLDVKNVDSLDEIADKLDMIWYKDMSVKERELVNCIMSCPQNELSNKLKRLLEEK